MQTGGDWTRSFRYLAAFYVLRISLSYFRQNMEIQKAIEYLNQRRALVDETITCLERLSETAVPPLHIVPAKRRGRKFMDAEDRQKVSERMKEYWALRRSQNSSRTQHSSGSA